MRNRFVTLPIVATLISLPQSHAQPSAPAFEAAAIKANKSGDQGMLLIPEPNGRIRASNVTLKLVLQMVYQVKEAQILGMPAWTDSERFDIEAKPDDSIGEELQKLTQRERIRRIQPMLQSLLAERFELTLHHETKELPVYMLLVAKGGPKFLDTVLTTTELEDVGRRGLSPGPGSITVMGRGQMMVNGTTLQRVTSMLSQFAGRIVIDGTGLKGDYSFRLHWAPDDGPGQPLKDPDGEPPASSAGPTLFAALQEQLGLKLEPQKSAVDVIVIDRIKRPSEN